MNGSGSNGGGGVGGNSGVVGGGGNGGGERDTFCDLVTSPRQGPAELVLPVEPGADVFQTKLAGVKPEREKNKKGGAGRTEGGEEAGGKKGGVRGRLARWFHKLGPSSSSR